MPVRLPQGLLLIQIPLHQRHEQRRHGQNGGAQRHDAPRPNAGRAAAEQQRENQLKIGLVFQSFNLVTRTTVIKNVLSACVPDMPFWRVLLGAFRKADKIKALESLDKVGILDKAYIRADQLSGGQQQRVALARTLTQDPQIILADEPVAALDPVTAKQVMQDFVRINQEMGISILLNIHHVELALEYADRIIGIRAGKIVYDGPSANVDKAVLSAIYGDDSETEADA